MSIVVKVQRQSYWAAGSLGRQNSGLFSAARRHEHLFRSSYSTSFDMILENIHQSSDVAQFHGYLIKANLDLQVLAVSKLLAAAITDMNYARLIFIRIENPTPFNYDTMLRGYSISENPGAAFSLFNCLRARHIYLDQFALIATFKCSARCFAVQMGECLHGLVVKSGFAFFLNLRNTLLHFYCVCGTMKDAHQLFDEMPQIRDVVSWNVLTAGYGYIYDACHVIKLFKLMCMEGFLSGSVATVIALSASSDLTFPLGSETFHAFCLKSGAYLILNVATAVVSMYGKIGCTSSALRLFCEIPYRDVVLWNCIIDAFARTALLEELTELLGLMRLEPVRPTPATFIGPLSACATAGSLSLGSCLHTYIEDEALELTSALGTALITMYSRCGCIEKAVDVFDEMPVRDAMCWTAMIDGFGLNGYGERALQMLYMMEKEGIKPNEVTYLAALSACRHAGLVTGGKDCFERMVRAHGILPKIEHYGCLTDLLGRAGLLVETYELIKRLPIEKDATAWRALLAACRVHCNPDLGKKALKRLTEIDDSHPTDVILRETLFIAGGRDELSRDKDSMELKRLKKETGWSITETASYSRSFSF